MSDLAGTRQERGFDDYLTGYPVKSVGYYALARTWLALEMPRPGCVWTHTLLIPFQSIADADGRKMLEIHRRPLGIMDAANYNDPVVSYSAGDVGQNLDLRLASAFVQALYGFPQQAVWISAPDTGAFEGLVVALWTQQWPELKREFGFSTGSLGPRRIESRLLDLQIVPESQSPSWFELRGVKDIGSIKTSVGWAKRAVADLSQGGAFEAFLRAVGTGGRSNYADFARLFVQAENARRHGRIDGVLNAGRSLEVSTSRRNAVWAFLLSPEFRLGDAQAIDLALRANKGTSVSHVGVSSRVARLARGNPRSLWSLIRGLSDSSASSLVGRRLLAATLREFSTSDLLSNLEADSPAIPEMVRIRSDLAADPRVWTGTAKSQRRILDVLASSDISKDRMAAILGSIVMAESAVGVSLAASRWPRMMSIAMLDALQNGQEPSPISVKTRQLLAGDAPAISDWLRMQTRPSDEVLTFLSQSVDTSEIFEVVPLARWAEFSKTGRLDGAGPYALSSLLKRGLSASGQEAMTLIANTFWPLDERLRARGFPERAWSIVEPALPPAGFLRQRGKLSRLREAVARKWVKNAFPLQVLLAAGGLTDLPGSLHRAIGDISGGKPYLRSQKGAFSAGGE